jgi:enoyl-CoA hydratase/carnithine racemase
VVAALHGTALGGGFELALACHFRVAVAGARVGLPEVKLGLIPGGGGTQRLARRIGAAAAKRTLMLGTLLDAEQALAAGVVDIVAAPGTAVDEAGRLAGRIAANPAVAVQAIKHAVDTTEADMLSDGLAAERSAFLEAFRSNDFQEGYTAFLEKRKPVFSHS